MKEMVEDQTWWQECPHPLDPQVDSGSAAGKLRRKLVDHLRNQMTLTAAQQRWLAGCLKSLNCCYCSNFLLGCRSKKRQTPDH